MNHLFSFLHHYGLLVLLGGAFIEQAGLPIPMTPLFIAAGALGATGEMSLWGSVGVSVGGAMVGDLIWYFLGLSKGQAVLRLLCRIAMEPDTCVRQTEERFLKRGNWALVFSKFIPGVGTAIRPLAAVAGVRPAAFLFYDGLGAVLYVGTFVALGYIFAGKTDAIIFWLGRAGHSAIEVLLGFLILYVIYKQIRRLQMRRESAIVRMAPEELKSVLDSKEPPVIIDLRTPLQVKEAPVTITGAVLISLPELRRRGTQGMDPSRDVVLFCACPKEATSAHAAGWLRHHGIIRARPLSGGIDLWKEKGFPLEPVKSMPKAEWGKLSPAFVSP